MSRLKSKDNLSEEYDEYLEDEEKEAEEFLKKIPIDCSRTVSTGCTLLDLNISGGRVKGGGLPGGILVELSGGSASGKTAMLMDIAGSVQHHGGSIRIADPEGRLDREYAKTFGTDLPIEDYYRPDLVLDERNKKTGKVIKQGMEGLLIDWQPPTPDAINMFGADSVAALSTSMEMDTADLRGQGQAKAFSTFGRKMARRIAEDNKLTVFTNQLRVGNATPTGVATKTTPGGFAIPYYSSLRVRSTHKKFISRTRKNEYKVEVKKDIGIEIELKCIKNSIDDPYRVCMMYLIFGHGISDVWGNLEYIKKMTGGTHYDVLDKTYANIEPAVKYIEQHDLEAELREWVIEEWEKNESLFASDFKQKRRF